MVVNFPDHLWIEPWESVINKEVTWLEAHTSQLCFVKPRWHVAGGLKPSQGVRWGAQIWFAHDEDIMAYTLAHSDRLMNVRKFNAGQMELYMSNVL